MGRRFWNQVQGCWGGWPGDNDIMIMILMILSGCYGQRNSFNGPAIFCGDVKTRWHCQLITTSNFRKTFRRVYFTSVGNHHSWFIFQALEYQSIICVIHIIYFNCIVKWYPELSTQENLWQEKTTFENQFIKTVFMEFESTVKTVFKQQSFSQHCDSQLVNKFESGPSKSLLLPGSQSSHLNSICSCC